MEQNNNFYLDYLYFHNHCRLKLVTLQWCLSNNTKYKSTELVLICRSLSLSKILATKSWFHVTAVDLGVWPNAQNMRVGQFSLQWDWKENICCINAHKCLCAINSPYNFYHVKSSNQTFNVKLWLRCKLDPFTVARLTLFSSAAFSIIWPNSTPKTGSHLSQASVITSTSLYRGLISIASCLFLEWQPHVIDGL